MVGLAFRAGKTLAGTAACEKGLKHRKIYLLLLQEGLSPSSRKGFLELCENTGVEVITIGNGDRLGDAIGRPEIMVLGVTDKRFAHAIRNNYVGGSGLNE
jgi:ribosomal protein L7Ae-like RNA K-turn-binding protein